MINAAVLINLYKFQTYRVNECYDRNKYLIALIKYSLLEHAIIDGIRNTVNKKGIKEIRVEYVFKRKYYSICNRSYCKKKTDLWI